MNTSKLVNFVIIALSGLILLGCSKPYYSTTPGEYFNPETGKVWVVDTDGSVQTNDFKELQKVTPFKIIKPTYLPIELDPALVMYSRSEGINKDNKYVKIYFYYTSGYKKMISVEEQNTENNLLEFDEQDQPIYFEYDGVKIIRLDLGYYDETQKTNYYRYNYMWHKNGVSFLLRTTEYDENESQKVVESMIR